MFVHRAYRAFRRISETYLCSFDKQLAPLKRTMLDRAKGDRLGSLTLSSSGKWKRLKEKQRVSQWAMRWETIGRGQDFEYFRR